MVSGYCMQCGDWVSNKADHLSRPQFQHHTVTTASSYNTMLNCVNGVHTMQFQVSHIPRLTIARGMSGEVLPVTVNERLCLPSGHIERLFCVHCGYTADKKYVVYRHNQHGDLTAMIPLGEGGTIVTEDGGGIRFHLLERFAAMMAQAGNTS